MNQGSNTAPAPRERRKSRQAVQYRDSIPLDDIIDQTCPIQVQEARDEKAAEASTYLRKLGITAVDVVRHDLRNESRESSNMKARKWFNEEGSVELLAICGERCDSKGFQTTICELAATILRTELGSFISTKKIHQPTTTITPETLTSFSLHTLSETMTTHAPLLSHLFRRLVINDRSETSNSNQSVSREGEAKEEEEWSESGDEGTRLSTENSVEKAARRLKEQTGRWVTAFSTLCYAKKRTANLQPMVMGYYLVSANAPKRVLEVLHKMGISVSYKSVVRTMKTIAKTSLKILRQFPSEYPGFWFSKDNMDFAAQVRDQRLDHQGALMHYCAGYVAINLLGAIPRMLMADDIDMLRAANISASDILLSQSDLQWQQNASAFGIYSVLKSYCGESMSYRSSGKDLDPVKLFTKHQIPIQKTHVRTLPVYARNESELGQMSELLRDIMKTLGLPVEWLQGKKIFSNGDLYTVIRERLSFFNIAADFRQAVECQQGSSLLGRLNHIEPVAGLFHLSMALINCLLKAHRLRDGDFGSLQSWIDRLHRFSGMWNMQTNKIKDFRACQSFLDHLLDGHVLAAVATEVGAGSWEELQIKLKGQNWRKVIARVESKFLKRVLVFSWRQEGMEIRDLVHENAVLFLQHGLIYRGFTEALKTGDSGWVVLYLKHFTIWLNNNDKKTSLPLYRNELINIMACLHHAFSPAAKDHWMNQCLVNLSGSPTGFRPCDLLGEYVIREMKRRLRHMLNVENDNFHRTVYAPQVMIAKQVREHIYKDVGAVQHYQHSSTVKSDLDVRHITEALLHERVFTQTPGRHHYEAGDGETIEQAVDLHGLGVAKLLDGTHLQAYKDRLGKVNGVFADDLAMEALDDILEVEQIEDSDDIYIEDLL